MSVLNMKLTNAGAALLAQASQVGPVVLSAIAIGSQQWDPPASTTALGAEIKQITAIDGGNAGGAIHLNATDGSADVYTVGEIGLITDGGVLFAIYSSSSGGPIFDKLTADTLFLALDVVFTNVPSTAPITVTGDATFVLPAATDTQAGIIRLATVAEVNAFAGAGLPSVSNVAAMITLSASNVVANHDSDVAALQADIDANAQKRPYPGIASRSTTVAIGVGANWNSAINLPGSAISAVLFTGEHYANTTAAGSLKFTGKAGTTTVFSGSCLAYEDWSSFAAIGLYSDGVAKPLDVTFAGPGSIRNLRCVLINFPF